MYTTFYVGLRANELGARFSVSHHPSLLSPLLLKLGAEQKIDKPHYHILFASSYGLSRRQLGDLDASIREKGPIRFDFEGTSFQKCSKPKGDFAVFESPVSSSATEFAPCADQFLRFSVQVSPSLSPTTSSRPTHDRRSFSRRLEFSS